MALLAVLDSDGKTVTPGQTVLDSDGVEYFVPTTVLDSDGNSHEVLLASTRSAARPRKGTIKDTTTKARFI